MQRLLVVGFLAIAESGNLDADSNQLFVNRLMSAKELLKPGADINEAIKEFQIIAAHWPSFPDGHHHLAMLYHKQGRTAEAEASLRKLVKVNPEDVSGHFNLGKCLADQKSFEKRVEATQVYQTAIQVGRSTAVPLKPGILELLYFNLANTYVKAVVSKQQLKASEVPPDSWSIRQLAMEAIVTYDTLLKLNSSYPDAQNNKDFVLENILNLEEAELTAAEEVRERTAARVMATEKAAVQLADEEGGVAM
jgi:tetratricopeptide (TPR) repeat protein